MKLSIIIVSWNVKEKLRENLQAILASDFDMNELEIFVVDNASADNTADMVRSEFPMVKLIANNANLGFAKANNQAIAQAKGGYILLLNPDMRVRPDTFRNMCRWMDEYPQVKLSGCRLVDERGNSVRHVRRFPRLADQLAIVLKLPHLFPGVLDTYLRSDFNYNCAAKVDSIRGGFFFMRNDGKFPCLLDERYFLWFEEVDYCRQLRQKGLEAWYVPAAECIDHVGQSFQQVGTAQKQKYFRDSMLKYFAKWHPHWEYYAVKTAWVLGLLISCSNIFLKIKGRTKT